MRQINFIKNTGSRKNLGKKLNHSTFRKNKRKFNN